MNLHKNDIHLTLFSSLFANALLKSKTKTLISLLVFI